jgi:hypothetical protein
MNLKCYRKLKLLVVPVAGEKWFDREESEDEKRETNELYDE